MTATERPSPPRLSTRKKAVFALVPAWILLALLELAVRVTGADQGCTTSVPEELWTCDPVLHFQANPALRPAGEHLNAAGFRSPEFSPARDGERQILVLGDSCTFGVVFTPALTFVEAPYPERLATLLSSKGRPTRVLNAAVPGYTTWHGLTLLKTKLRDLRPDILIARFGWNDLYMNHNGAGEALREPTSLLQRTAQDTLARSALYRFGVKLRLQSRRPPDPMQRLEAAGGQWKPAVPLADYERHLRRIVEIGRQRGAAVYLLTEPHAFLLDEYRGRYDLFEDDLAGKGYVDLNLLDSFDHLLSIHAKYMDAVRRVARDTGAPLIDLEAAYRAHASEHLYGDADIVHALEAGHQLEARVIAEALSR